MKKIMFNDKFGLTQAVLDGRKTMTRRIVPQCILDAAKKYQEEYYAGALEHISLEDAIMNMVGPERMFDNHVYKVGEMVAIAQSYATIGKIIYGTIYNNKMFVKAEYMPHHIRILRKWQEHLQNISDEDCLKEGVLASDKYAMPYGIQTPKGVFFYYSTPREAFAALIDKVSGKGTWDRNPLVWVYEFELID